MFLRSLGVSKDDIVIVNQDETALTKALYNTDLWQNKHVIVSPSITIGVDFVPEGKRNVFSWVRGSTINPIAVSQQIFRCRKINSIFTLVEAQARQPTIPCLKYVSKMFDQIRPIELYEKAENEDIFNYILAYQLYVDDITMADFTKYIDEALLEKGYKREKFDALE